MDLASAKATQNFKDLLVWQRGMALAKKIYQITRIFPSVERFGLIAQMRRCAVSIRSNLTEGQARHTTRESNQSQSRSEARCPKTSQDRQLAPSPTEQQPIELPLAVICH
jgi:hypothetical protein